MGAANLSSEEYEAFRKRRESLKGEWYSEAMNAALSLPPQQRDRFQVYLLRSSVYGCCNAHADNSACDCMERAWEECSRCEGKGEGRWWDGVETSLQVCNLCRGTGKIISDSVYGHAPERETCKECGGAGKLGENGQAADIDKSPTPAEEARRNGLVEIYQGHNATVSVGGKTIPVKELKVPAKELPFPQNKIMEKVTYQAGGFRIKQDLLRDCMNNITGCSDILGDIEDMIEKGLLLELFYQLPGKTRPSSLIFPGGTEMRTWKTERPKGKVMEVERE